jgi:hypothetical protein
VVNETSWRLSYAITKGNPIYLPPGKKTRRASPLQIAIEKGFLTRHNFALQLRGGTIESK